MTSLESKLKVADGYVNYGDTVYAVLPFYNEIKRLKIEPPPWMFDGFVASLEKSTFLKQEDLEKMIYIDKRRANMELKLRR
jgi:hypothetical protein